MQKSHEAGGSEKGSGMSRSKSHGNLSLQPQTQSPGRLTELEPEQPSKSFSSHGSGDASALTLQDQVPSRAAFSKSTACSTIMPAVKHTA